MTSSADVFANVFQAAGHLTFDIDSMLQSVADNVARETDAALAAICLADKTGRQFQVRAKAGSNSLKLGNQIQKEIGNSSSRLALAAKSGQASVINDIAADPEHRLIWTPSSETASFAGYPLIWDDRHLGLLALWREKPFEQEIESILRPVADLICIAAEGQRRFDSEGSKAKHLLRANKFLEFLSRVASHLETAKKPGQVFEILGQVLKKIGMFYIVYLLDGEEENLAVRYSSIDARAWEMAEQVLGKSLQDFKVPLHINGAGVQDDLAPTGRIALKIAEYSREIKEKKKGIYIPDLFRFKMQSAQETIPEEQLSRVRRALEMSGIRDETAGILLPLILNAHVVGIIAVWGQTIHKTDVRPLSVFAGQIASAMENARLFDEVQRLATIDELTGINNRRNLFILGEKELARSLRFGHALSAIMLDIDHFKKVNDTYSHAVGDIILHDVARRCCLFIRDVDIIGRYGGEEFAIVLPEAGPKKALQIAERIRRAVAEAPFVAGNRELSVTVSLGVASASKQSTDLSSVLEMADGALYVAKNEGRNCVRVSEAQK